MLSFGCACFSSTCQVFLGTRVPGIAIPVASQPPMPKHDQYHVERINVQEERKQQRFGRSIAVCQNIKLSKITRVPSPTTQTHFVVLCQKSEMCCSVYVPYLVPEHAKQVFLEVIVLWRVAQTPAKVAVVTVWHAVVFEAHLVAGLQRQEDDQNNKNNYVNAQTTQLHTRTLLQRQFNTWSGWHTLKHKNGRGQL